MATFYLDLENGSDAADGTTFANRWKTLLNGATAARIAPGDTIRIMASPPPYSPGSATWTDNDGTVTWGSSKNKVVDNCDSAWTAATDITTAAVTTVYKEGTASMQVTPATNFTTGKMAYKTLASTDFSAFEAVSFWIRGNGSGYSGSPGILQLKLCSDTTGDTPVDSFDIPVFTNSWRTCLIDKGSALGSAIQSVAIYATTDPSTNVFQIDNIVAAKSPGNANHVSHGCAIGKYSAGEPEWYGISSIQDSSVELGAYMLNGLGSSDTQGFRPYRGTTESVATYVHRGIDTTALITNALQSAETGTTNAPITYSGGWNRTDMSTQEWSAGVPGYTYLNGQYYANAQYLYQNLNHDFIRWNGFGMIGQYYALYGSTNTNQLDLQVDSIVGGYYGIYPSNFDLQLTIGNNAWGNYQLVYQGTGIISGIIKARRIHGVPGNTLAAAVNANPAQVLMIDKIDNNAGIGLQTNNLGDTAEITLHGCTFANNTTDVGYSNLYKSAVNLFNCSAVSAPSFSASYAAYNHRTARLTQTNIGGDSTAHRTDWLNHSLVSETSVRHTASGLAWKLSPTADLFCSWKPALFTLARIACAAGKQVTFKCWLRRTNTGIDAGIQVRGKTIPGVTSDVRTMMTAAADTWQQIQIQFTPTQAGVYEVEGLAWGGTTYSAYFDDVEVAQP